MEEEVELEEEMEVAIEEEEGKEMRKGVRTNKHWIIERDMEKEKDAKEKEGNGMDGIMWERRQTERATEVGAKRERAKRVKGRGEEGDDFWMLEVQISQVTRREETTTHFAAIG